MATVTDTDIIGLVRDILAPAATYAKFASKEFATGDILGKAKVISSTTCLKSMLLAASQLLKDDRATINAVSVRNMLAVLIGSCHTNQFHIATGLGKRIDLDFEFKSLQDSIEAMLPPTIEEQTRKIHARRALDYTAKKKSSEAAK
jgi:hypothetical protein